MQMYGLFFLLATFFQKKIKKAIILQNDGFFDSVAAEERSALEEGCCSGIGSDNPQAVALSEG